MYPNTYSLPFKQFHISIFILLIIHMKIHKYITLERNLFQTYVYSIQEKKTPFMESKFLAIFPSKSIPVR